MDAWTGDHRQNLEPQHFEVCWRRAERRSSYLGDMYRLVDPHFSHCDAQTTQGVVKTAESGPEGPGWGLSPCISMSLLTSSQGYEYQCRTYEGHIKKAMKS